MSGAQPRLNKLASQFLPILPSATPESAYNHRHNIHTLSPTHFLPRAAKIEPEVSRKTMHVPEMLTTQAGRGHLPCHSKRQDTTQIVRRSRKQGERVSILYQITWVQEGGHTLPEHTRISRIDIRNSSGWGNQRWYITYSILRTRGTKTDTERS